MIVITGAAGALNGATAEHLLKRIPAGQIGVSVREVAKAQHFADRGVRGRRGSYLAARQGCFAGVDPILGDLLGRQPRTVRDLLAERPAA